MSAGQCALAAPATEPRSRGTEIMEGNLEVVMGRDAHRATAELCWMPSP